MTSFGVAVAGGAVVAHEFERLGKTANARANRLVRHHGQLLKTRVQANASGRPGPNAPTGDYRRSIALELVTTGDVVTAYVGTNLPQGRRLEFGFHGADSLGRVYNQQPYPHFGPALDQTSGGFIAAMTQIVSSAT